MNAKTSKPVVKAAQAKNPKKTAKPARAPKAPKAPQAAAAPDARTIEVLVKENPRRPGTGRHALFEIITACAGQTVAVATERGATSAAIASVARHGWIRLVE